MLDFCQPVSYYAKLSVLWVKKLLSEVEHLTYSPISPIPYPLSDSLSNTSHKEADILLSCPPRITFSCQSLQLPSNSGLGKGSIVSLHISVLWFYFIITARHRVVFKSELSFLNRIHISSGPSPESLRYCFASTSCYNQPAPLLSAWGTKGLHQRIY